MKHIIKSLVVAGSVLVAGSGNADEIIELLPYMGVDYHQAWMKPKITYQPIFPSSYPGVSFYVGTKFHPNFAFELGYDWSLKQTKSWTTTQSIPGTNTLQTFGGTTKIRRSGAYLDLVAFLPLVENLEMLASFGAGWVQPKIEIVNMSVGPGQSKSSAIASLSGDGRGVLRGGVGVGYMLTEVLGLRAKLGWESTFTLRVDGNTYAVPNGYLTRGFKGSVTFSMGAYYKF